MPSHGDNLAWREEQCCLLGDPSQVPGGWLGSNGFPFPQQQLVPGSVCSQLTYISSEQSVLKLRLFLLHFQDWCHEPNKRGEAGGAQQWLFQSSPNCPVGHDFKDLFVLKINWKSTIYLRIMHGVSVLLCILPLIQFMSVFLCIFFQKVKEGIVKKARLIDSHYGDKVTFPLLSRLCDFAIETISKHLLISPSHLKSLLVPPWTLNNISPLWDDTKGHSKPGPNW